MIAEVPKYKMITASILSDRLRVSTGLQGDAWVVQPSSARWHSSSSSLSSSLGQYSLQQVAVAWSAAAQWGSSMWRPCSLRQQQLVSRAGPSRYVARLMYGAELWTHIMQ